jgi:hypothetical protein
MIPNFLVEVMEQTGSFSREWAMWARLNINVKIYCFSRLPR